MYYPWMTLFIDLWNVKYEDGDTNNGGKRNGDQSSVWACLNSLHSSSLKFMSKVQSLPSGIGHLTHLQWLSIWEPSHLKTLPESIRLLTQLRVLKLQWCSELEAFPKSIQNLTVL